jgi:hypothetical protein
MDRGFLDIRFDIRHVVLLGEFLVAVFAMESVLTHDPTPANMIPPGAVDGR